MIYKIKKQAKILGTYFKLKYNYSKMKSKFKGILN